MTFNKEHWEKRRQDLLDRFQKVKDKYVADSLDNANAFLTLRAELDTQLKEIDAIIQANNKDNQNAGLPNPKKPDRQ